MTAGSHRCRSDEQDAVEGARESSERQRTENDDGSDDDYSDDDDDEEIEIEEEREDLVWYFSYGSNMNPEVFEKKRGIRCLDHRVCTAPGYVLSYSESLLPWCEPAFCTCVRRNADLPCCLDKPDIHGVAFLITREQYEHVLLTEGGWGYQEHRSDPLWSVGQYAEEEIECVEIEPETETEVSETTAAASSANAGRRRRFKAMTLAGLLSDFQRHDANCSKRYYDIVNEGALSSGLPASYRDYLRERHPAYEMSSCWRAKLAMILYWLVAFPCVFLECWTAHVYIGRNERKLKAAAAAAAEKTATATNDPATGDYDDASPETTVAGVGTTTSRRRRFETVTRPPWILLKLCHLYKCVALERVMLPLLTDLCKLPSGYRNNHPRRSSVAGVAKTTVDGAAAETGR